MSTPNNLPAELTSFVGREAQLADLRRVLRRTRLVTLTGPGGVGKTRLALRLISGVAERYPGGAWVIQLGPITDVAGIERGIAAACGVREVANTALVSSVIERLGAAPNVLMLDGAEHLVAAAREAAERLLRAVPNLTLVVTSREPLGAAGETVWQTPPLTLPHTRDRAASEAVRLFLIRAAQARSGFAVDHATESDVADVCRRLDGLPLAIELAASSTAAMSVKEIAARLADREELRRRGRRAMPRFEALDRAIDSSYRLLTTGESDLFLRLAIFVAGFDAAAAEEVGSMDGEDVLPTLTRLVDKSLVVAEPRTDGRTRYRMLDTIREFALARLPQAQATLLRARLAGHCLRFAQTAATELRVGHQAAWLDRIEEDMPNLWFAFSWFCVESPGEAAALAGQLARYWYVRGKLSEGLEWFDRALESPDMDAGNRLRALQNRARLRRHHGDYSGARADAEACIELGRRSGEDLHVMGGFVTLGNLSASLGRWDDAERCFAQALDYQLTTKDQALIAGGLNNLALVQSARGDHEAAKARIDQAVQLAESANDRILQATIRESAGRIERRRGDRRAARAHYVKALDLSARFEDIVNIADVLDGMSLMALAERDPSRALILAAASRGLRSSVQAEPQRWDQREIEEGVARARSQLRGSAANAAWKRGHAMTLREAVAFASGTSTTASTNGIHLTAREAQVAGLIADGLTNGQIAARLRMAERTADAHVEHIRNKLGLHNRAQIAVWAHDQLDH